MKLSEEAIEFLERNKIKKYTLNSDGTVDVDGDVDIREERNRQCKWPVKFKKVNGRFNCNGVLLPSLDELPRIVNLDFICSANKLVSLEGTPSYIGGNFWCSYNDLTSLHDIHKHVKELNGAFYCHRNPITNSVLGLLMIKGIRGISLENRKVQAILNKHIRNGRAGIIAAQQELFDAGLDEYARL